MNRDYLKDYIEFSNEFRKSNSSKESISKLYDLLYEMKNIERTKKDDLVLSNLYSLLEFHESAYETFKIVADLSNKKDISRLYVLEQKAKSHKNNFIIKDVRKYREKKKQPQIELNDFKLSKKHENKFKITDKKLVVFNKITKKGKVSIYLPNDNITLFLDKIIDYITWLGNCKNDLIDFFNNEGDENAINKADNNWFDTLEIYRVEITIDDFGSIFTSITAGDDFYRDHLLEIEIDKRSITSMGYNG